MYVHTKLSHMLKVVNPALLDMKKILFLCQKSGVKPLIIIFKQALSACAKLVLEPRTLFFLI
jgi:hypothetical protein